MTKLVKNNLLMSVYLPATLIRREMDLKYMQTVTAAHSRA